MTVQERLWLGHHQNEVGKMAITYARDALVAVLIKLRRVVDSIRDGHFNPDPSRVERVSMMTGIVANLPPLEEGKDGEQFLEPESEGDDSDVEATENLTANPLPLNLEAVNSKLDREKLARSYSLLKHRLSGMVHILKDSDRVACGGAVTGITICHLSLMQTWNSTNNAERLPDWRHRDITEGVKNLRESQCASLSRCHM